MKVHLRAVAGKGEDGTGFDIKATIGWTDAFSLADALTKASDAYRARKAKGTLDGTVPRPQVRNRSQGRAQG